MLLGFQDRFIPMIKDGSKTHTIRAGTRLQKFQRFDLYQRPRQRDMTLIFRCVCTGVESIKLRFDLGTRKLVGEVAEALLRQDELDLLAWRDGFRFEGRPKDPNGCARLMGEYWTHRQGAKPFQGQLAFWSYDHRFTDIGESCHKISLVMATIMKPTWKDKAWQSPRLMGVER